MEPELRGNRETLEGLVVRLEAFRDDTAGCVSQLSLRGNASPDGTAAANVRLTRKRVEAVLSYLRQWVEIPDGLVEVQANGFDWEGLQLRVEDDPECPARQEVLEVLSDTPEWMYDAQGRIVDGRRKRLMDLRGGSPVWLSCGEGLSGFAQCFHHFVWSRGPTPGTEGGPRSF